MIRERRGAGREAAGWTVGAGMATHSTYLLSLNIGPGGWRKSKPAILHALEGTPAVLALQD
eukprot:15000-Rhodomonas_salina.1